MSAERTAIEARRRRRAEHVRPPPDGRPRHAGAEGQGLQGHAPPAHAATCGRTSRRSIVVIARRRRSARSSACSARRFSAWRRRRSSRASWRGHAGAPAPASTSTTSAAFCPTLLVLYVVSAAFQYLQQYLMANVAQKTVYAMRREVEAKFEPAAAEVLRLAHARRDAEPRRQRPGQHQQHAAAEPDAADDVGADGASASSS